MKLSGSIEQLTLSSDLARRLPLVPPSAAVRGMYFRSIQAVLGAAGKLDEFSSLVPERFTSLRWYPLERYLVHLAVGAALLTSPDRIHEGMYELGRHWLIIASAHARFLQGDAASSPITEERTNYFASVGVAYRF